MIVYYMDVFNEIKGYVVLYIEKAMELYEILKGIDPSITKIH